MIVLNVVVAACIIGIWVVTGVALGEIARYVTYLAVIVVGPGLVIYRRLMGRAGLGLAAVLIAIPVAWSVRVSAFAVLRFFGVSTVSWLGAVAFAAVSYGISRRQPAAAQPEREASQKWLAGGALAAICLSSVVLLALRDFQPHPLPDHIREGVVYYRDIPWHLGNITALPRGWPLQNPRLDSESLHYHVGSYIFTAGASHVAGIAPSTLLLRLDPVFLVVVFCLQLAWLGRQCTGSALVGVLTAGIVLLAGDASSLVGAIGSIFGNHVVTNLFRSPTFLLGLVLFVPLVGSGASILAGRATRSEILTWLLCLPGCALAKPTTLPVLGAAAIGYAVLQWIRTRHWSGPALLLALSTIVAFAAVGPIVLPETSGELMRWEPLASVRISGAWRIWRGEGMSGTLCHVLITLGHAPMLLLGIAAFLWAKGLAPGIWLGLLAAAGASVALLFTAGGGSQLYFWYYGYVAAGVLAASGIASLLTLEPRIARWSAMLIVAALGLVTTASVVLQSRPGIEVLMGDSFRIFLRNPDNQIPGPPAVLSPQLATGLRWIAHNTEPRALLAVSTQKPPFYYSALTERAVFFEDSIYTVEFFTAISRHDRETATRELFEASDAARLCEVAGRYGIEYLVRIKEPAGSAPSPAAPPELSVVFDSQALSVVSTARCRPAARR